MPLSSLFAVSKTQRLSRFVIAMGGLLGAGAIALLAATQAQALEKIRLISRFGTWPDLSVEELNEFAATRQPPQNIQKLIDFVDFFTDIDEAQAHEYLTSETSVNRDYLLEASYTEVGERFYRLASNAIAVPDESDQTWVYLRDAMLTASDEEKASAIEFIQALDANTLEIDTEKFRETSEQIERDEDVMNFLRTAFPEIQ